MWLVRICLEKTYSSVNLPGLCLFCYVLKFVTNKWYLHNFATHNNPRAASGCAGSQVCDAFQTGELLLLVLLLGLCSSQRSVSSLFPPNTLQPSPHCRLQLLMPTKCFCSEDQCHYSKMDVLLPLSFAGGMLQGAVANILVWQLKFIGLDFYFVVWVLAQSLTAQLLEKICLKVFFIAE